MRRDEFDQAGEKIKALHAVLDNHSDDKFWTYGNRIVIPISSRSASAVATNGPSGGIIQSDAVGRPSLLIAWLPKDEVYTLGYMMSAAVAINRNAVDRKAEEYLKEALGTSAGWYPQEQANMHSTNRKLSLAIAFFKPGRILATGPETSSPDADRLRDVHSKCLGCGKERANLVEGNDGKHAAKFGSGNSSLRQVS